MFHLIWMFIVGIVVGAIARLIMPGSEHMGLIMTGVVGIVGSFIGGFIARLFSKPADGALVPPAGLIRSVIGALILCPVIAMLDLDPLPGDFTLRWETTHFYMPFTESLIVSVSLTLLFFLLRR